MSSEYSEEERLLPQFSVCQTLDQAVARRFGEGKVLGDLPHCIQEARMSLQQVHDLRAEFMEHFHEFHRPVKGCLRRRLDEVIDPIVEALTPSSAERIPAAA